MSRSSSTRDLNIISESVLNNAFTQNLSESSLARSHSEGSFAKFKGDGEMKAKSSRGLEKVARSSPLSTFVSFTLQKLGLSSASREQKDEDVNREAYDEQEDNNIPDIDETEYIINEVSLADTASEFTLSFLTYDLLLSAVQTYESLDGDSKFLINSLKSVFSSTTSLSKSFLDPKASHPSKLDLEGCDKAYDIILSLPQYEFKNLMINATDILLAKLMISVPKMKELHTQELLRVVLIVLQVLIV